MHFGKLAAEDRASELERAAMKEHHHSCESKSESDSDDDGINIIFNKTQAVPSAVTFIVFLGRGRSKRIDHHLDEHKVVPAAVSIPAVVPLADAVSPQMNPTACAFQPRQVSASAIPAVPVSATFKFPMPLGEDGESMEGCPEVS